MTRYNELKEKAENAAIMTRAQRMITLSDIAQFSKKDDSRIKAIDTLNKMDGIYTNKIELSKPVDETVKEMTEYLNGRIENDS
ncbi:phage terminase small subunit [Clostridium sp. CAG:678]|nr:phage terminase small subunit [Clostridium sp. CAG:678]